MTFIRSLSRVAFAAALLFPCLPVVLPAQDLSRYEELCQEARTALKGMRLPDPEGFVRNKVLSMLLDSPLPKVPHGEQIPYVVSSVYRDAYKEVMRNSRWPSIAEDMARLVKRVPSPQEIIGQLEFAQKYLEWFNGLSRKELRVWKGLRRHGSIRAFCLATGQSRHAVEKIVNKFECQLGRVFSDKGNCARIGEMRIAHLLEDVSGRKVAQLASNVDHCVDFRKLLALIGGLLGISSGAAAGWSRRHGQSGGPETTSSE